MNKNIINLKYADLGNIRIPEHPCMPDITDIPEETWGLINNNELSAMCSLWTEKTPSYENLRTGIIGNFFAVDSEAGISILRYASAGLKKKGVEYAVGPMNGNTWHSYRLISDAGNHPPFFMEYYTPKTWPEIFTSAEFEVIAEYSSAKTVDLIYEDRTAKKFEKKISEMDLIIRPFDPAKAEEELAAIHALAIKSFSKNFLYSDISLSRFMKLYKKIVPLVDPDFFLLVEHNGNLVGFIFAIPDYTQKQRGEVLDSIVIKTLAKASGRRYAGLGGYLNNLIHERAAAKGFKTAVHALMYENNASRIISGKSGHIIRKYALFGKSLVS